MSKDGEFDKKNVESNTSVYFAGKRLPLYVETLEKAPG
jgi:hypothetical protein